MTETMMCGDFGELLQTAHEIVECTGLSPDSGVASGVDSEPSSPVLSSSHLTQLTNADFSGFSASDSTGVPMTPDDWFQHSSSLFPTGDDPAYLLTPAEDKGTSEFQQHQLPTLVSEQMETAVGFEAKGSTWVETTAGFQMCFTNNGYKVNLGGCTYDIDPNIDIPDTLPLATVKTEVTPDSTSGRYDDFGCMPMDINNNNNNNDNNNNTSNVINNTIFSIPVGNYHDGFHTTPNGASHSLHSYYNDSHNLCPYVHAEAPEEPARKRRQSVTRTERLWEFIFRLLGDPKHNPRLIEWVDRDDCTFRLNNSKAIALMWGMRKNNQQMTYEKLSRALRYYYHRQILEPVLGKKLVYRFGPNAVQVWENRIYRPQDHGIQYNPREPKSPDKRNKGA